MSAPDSPPADDRRTARYYLRHDSEDAYERRFGYGNRNAAAAWALRDELVRDAVASFRPDIASRRNLRAVEIGSGHGHELAKLAALGISERSLVGIELVPARAERSRAIYRGVPIVVASGRSLPLADRSTDLVTQFTCFCHLLDPESRRAVAGEIERILRPGGLFVWWELTPEAPAARHVHRAVRLVRRLFPIPEEPLPEPPSGGDDDRVIRIPEEELRELFPNVELRIRRAGLSWSAFVELDRRWPSLAAMLYRSGWFSEHLFGAGLRR